MSLIEFQGSLQTPEMATTGTVPSGTGWWIVGTDGKPYFKNDAQTVTEIATTAYADAIKAGAKGSVNHGATAGTARPTGFASIEWIGSVEPTAMENGDTWINTA